MNKLSKTKFFALFLLVMMSSAAHGQNGSSQQQSSFQNGESGAASEGLLQKITFQGLKRTKDSYLQGELETFINRPLTPKTMSVIESDLQAMNLFSSINIEKIPASDGNLELKITVKEKITFIPLPFAMYSSGTGFMCGGFVMDMNAGGQKDMFVTGLLWSLDNTMVMGLYSHSPKIGLPGFRLIGSVNNQTRRLKNSDGDTLLKYEHFGANASGSILFKLNRYNNLDAGLGYAGFFPKDQDIHKDLYVRNRGIASAGWNIMDKEWNGVFLSETSFGLDGKISLDNKAHATTSVTSTLKIQQPLIQKLRLNIDGGAGIVFNGLITDGLGKSSARVTILEDKFSTPKIAGAATGLELAFLHIEKIGTFSIYGNYEFVFAQEFDDSLLFCQGFNTGMKVYLKGLAFPALSMGLAYNATKNQFSFAGSFGVSF